MMSEHIEGLIFFLVSIAILRRITLKDWRILKIVLTLGVAKVFVGILKRVA